MQTKTVMICPKCGSSDISCDAAARWCAEIGEWVLSSLQDCVTCEHCGAEEIDTISVEVEVVHEDLRDLIKTSPPRVFVPLHTRAATRYADECPKAMFWFDRLANFGPGVGGPPDANRAGGDALCEVCNHRLYNHPHHPYFPELTLLCNGEVVKL